MDAVFNLKSTTLKQTSASTTLFEIGSMVADISAKIL